MNLLTKNCQRAGILLYGQYNMVLQILCSNIWDSINAMIK